MLNNRVANVTVSAAAAITLSQSAGGHWNGFHIRNGAATVTLSLSGLTIPVYSNEVLEMDTATFTQITIENVSTVSVRLALKK